MQLNSRWKSRCRSALLATVVVVGWHVHAQTLPDAAGLPLSLEELASVELYATDQYVRQLTRSGSVGSVVTEEDIRAFGYRNLSDILRSLPGLYVSYDRSYSYLASRGYGNVGDWNSRILFLVDGHRINENIYDSAYIGNDFLLDVDLIERVEYVAGPAAAMLYGNNAFLGVVNVISKNGLLANGSEVALGAGSAGTYQARWSHGKRFESGLDVLLSVSRYDSDGSNLDLPELGGRANGLDWERASRAFAKFSYGGLRLEMAGVERRKGVPNAAYQQVFNDPRSATWDDQGFVSLTYNHALGNDSAISGRLFHGRYDYRQDFVLEGTLPGEALLYRDLANGRWWGGEFKYVSAQLGPHKLLVGADFQRNSARDQSAGYVGAPLDLDDKRSSTAWGLYVHDEWALAESFRLGLGGRFDHTALGESEFHPRLAATYQWLPQTTVKLQYGEAFRPPNVFELYYGDGVTYVPNPALKSETTRTTEAVLEHRWGSGDRSVLTLFHTRVNDLIDYVLLSSPAGAYQLQNLRDVTVKGLEAVQQFYLDSGGVVTASYNWQRARDASGEAVQNSPRQMAKLNWRQPLGGSDLQLGTELQCMGQRSSVEGTHVPGVCVVNAALSGRWQRQTDWSVGLRNLGNRTVDDPSSSALLPLTRVRQDGRTWFAQATHRF